MKVLLSAFSCTPGSGSEPGIGWGIVSQVAARHECWVLTHPANRQEIEAELARNPLPNAHFIYIEPKMGLLWPTNPVNKLHYAGWQLQALRVARQLQRTIGFDLVHHLTYGNCWLPSPLACVGARFIWNAGCKEITPLSFLSSFSLRGRIYELARTLALTLLPKVLLTDKLTARRSDLILSSSSRSCWPARLPVVEFPIGGLPRTEIERLADIPIRPSGPLRLLSIGRLLPWKGFSLAIGAFARLRKEFPDAQYTIVGTGMEQSHLQRLATRYGVQDAVTFVSWVPRERIRELLAEADVLVHPSFHEQFGYVLLEAMAAGRPVLCLDMAGPRALVAAEAGIAISVQGPEQVENDLWLALRRLALNPELRMEMGYCARQHVLEHWDWENVGRRLLRIYEGIVNTQPELELVSPGPVEAQGSYR